MADGAPREQQVGQFFQGRAPLGNDLELRLVQAQLVLCLYEQPAGDAFEIQVGDAVVAWPFCWIRRHFQKSDLRLLGQDPDGGTAEGRRDHGFE